MAAEILSYLDVLSVSKTDRRFSSTISYVNQPNLKKVTKMFLFFVSLLIASLLLFSFFPFLLSDIDWYVQRFSNIQNAIYRFPIQLTRWVECSDTYRTEKIEYILRA